jgi:putative addiction module CopG family antidote
MNISLNPEQEKFIKQQIEKGKYTNALDVISATFQVLKHKELQPDNLHQKKVSAINCYG